MVLLKRMNELIKEGSQFIIATHSPVILSYPNAMIYEMGKKGAKLVKYDECQHVKVMREFMNDPKLDYE